jgi:hypothetical protein
MSVQVVSLALADVVVNDRSNLVAYRLGESRPSFNERRQCGVIQSVSCIDCTGFRTACFRNGCFLRGNRGLFESRLGYLSYVDLVKGRFSVPTNRDESWITDRCCLRPIPASVT